MILDKITLKDVRSFLSSSITFIDTMIEIKNRPDTIQEGANDGNDTQ